MTALNNTTAIPAQVATVATDPGKPGKPGTAFTAAQLVPNALLRMKDTCAVAGVSRPTLYELMAAGLWPRPIKLGEKSVAWKASEVNAMLAARVRGASNDELCALAKALTEARQHCV